MDSGLPCSVNGPESRTSLHHHRRPQRCGPCYAEAATRRHRKTTFARSYLLQETGVANFINADLIATGLSPLKPERAARAAGRILLAELGRLTRTRESFALESTLSGKTYIKMIQDWKRRGYHVQIIFLQLDSSKLAVHRVAMRVIQGGHDVPKPDILRRFDRGSKNFVEHYQALADHWMLYDASGAIPVLLSEHTA